MRLYILISMAVLIASCGDGTNNSKSNSAGNKNINVSATRSTALPVYTYDIVKAYPHDPKAFTQGLLFHNGFLYEGTGGKMSRGDDYASSLRKVDLETGRVLQKYDVARDFFAEGITLLNGKIYQLTWQERTGFVYNVDDFKLLREFRYIGDGWGLANDGSSLIMSDGTHVLKFIDPETFLTTRTIVVNDETGRPLMKLNELEYVKGEIWANVWHSEEINKPNHIARIDPASGKLLGWIDLGNISPDDQNDDNEAEHTLNGIAYDAGSDRIFVTGKNWKKLFEITVRPK